MSLKRAAASTLTSSAKKAKANGSITSFFGPPKIVSSTKAKAEAEASITVNGSSPAGDHRDDASASCSSSPLEDARSTAAAAAALSSPPATSPLQPAKLSAAKQASAKPSSAKPSIATAPFDKAAWVAKLSGEERELLTLEIETLHESWLGALADEIRRPEFLELKRFLKREHDAGKQIFPPAADVYSWSRHTPLPTVKVVILGQDPYHNEQQAHGLCFSVRPPTPAPPSLRNIFKALSIDYPETFAPPPRRLGLLTPWAERGVLLLNTCLTVRAHAANSHAGKGWERFTQRVIDVVAERRAPPSSSSSSSSSPDDGVKRGGVVFLAWGSPAGKRVAGIKTRYAKRHHVLNAVHPSPLSASRGWFECGHFRKANDWLRERYGDDGVIDWNLDVEPGEAGV